MGCTPLRQRCLAGSNDGLHCPECSGNLFQER